VPLATYDGYYEEAREVSLIPEGSRSQPGMLMGVGPGLCSVRTSENSSSRDCLENSQRVLNCLWLVAQEGEMGHFVSFWPLANTPD
jgi:hypothetical protein